MIQREARPRNLIRETRLGQWTWERGQRGEFFSSDTLRYKSISGEISWNWVRLLGVRSDCFWCEVLTAQPTRQHSQIQNVLAFCCPGDFWKKFYPPTGHPNQDLIKTHVNSRVHGDAILGNTGRMTSKLDQRNTGSQSQIHPNLQEVRFNTLLTQHRGL